jgi:hypothetical protein
MPPKKHFKIKERGVILKIYKAFVKEIGQKLWFSPKKCLQIPNLAPLSVGSRERALRD